MEQVSANTATAPAEVAPSTPTLDQMVEEYINSEMVERGERVPVFKECIKDGTVTVSTEAQASEIARLITSAEKEIERVTAVADAMVQRAQQRLKSIEGIFIVPLSIWTSARLAGAKTRSMILPGGKLALRKIPEGTHYVDQQKTIEWAQVNLPSAVEMIPKIKTDAIKAFEEKENFVAPGREKRAAYETFSVTTPKPK